MRVRTLFTFSTGIAVGAGAMYLLDPQHGEARRRDARKVAMRQARSGAASALAEARRRTEEAAVAAVSGYRQARKEADVDPGAFR